jgi:catechol 2,3-dioxygenase-like lactoylglutathione lyase family enzyme
MTTENQLLNGVDFIAFPTRDWEAARKFYGETLGLPFGKQWGEMPAGEFETGTVTIALMQVDAFGMEFDPSSTPLEFHVDDFDSAKAELESRGVEFVTDVIDSGVCKQAIFRDPDGNSLAIHHRYAEGAPPKEAADAALETAQQGQ